jgi:hypothetical protein
MSLTTRKPTGKVAFPLISLEGEDKTGRTYAALSLSKSENVGRTFAFDLGEGTVDEYAALGPYEVVDHDGTYSDLMAKMRLACAEPMVDDKPNVLALDTGTQLWNQIKDWTDRRARRSNAGRKALEQDPDAAIDPSMNLWNDAGDRWGQMVALLKNWSGVAIVTVDASEVTEVVGGRPTNKTVWKPDAQKRWPHVVTARVRMDRPHKATLTACRSLDVEVPTKGLALPDANPLEHLVFSIMGVAGFGKPSATTPQQTNTASWAMVELLSIFTEALWPDDEAKAAARATWDASPCKGRTKDDEVTDAEWAELEDAARSRLTAKPEPEPVA